MDMIHTFEGKVKSGVVTSGKASETILNAFYTSRINWLKIKKYCIWYVLARNELIGKIAMNDESLYFASCQPRMR